MLNIFVAETVPSQNKGEAALMHGIMRSINEYAEQEVHYSLCSERPVLDQIEYGESVTVLDNPGLVPLGDGGLRKLLLFTWRSVGHFGFLVSYYLLGAISLKLFRDPLWRAYFEADVIIVGHDNAFSKFHIPLILYAKLLGKPAAVYGATIMPVVLNSGVARLLGKYALNKVDLITCRESITFDHLKSINVDRAPLYCTADKAFILDSISDTAAEKLLVDLNIHDLPRPLIGVMVVKGSTVFKAAFTEENYPPAEKYDRHVEEIALALDGVHSQTGGTFIFVPHCIGPGDDLDDRICARHVKEKMAKADHAYILNQELRVVELKGLMGQFDLVVSERTHGGINAATMYTPTLWITHPKDHRTYGIVTSTLKLPQCLYNIQYLNHLELTKKIVEVWEDKESIVKVLKETVPEAYKATMSNGQLFKKHVLDKQ